MIIKTNNKTVRIIIHIAFWLIYLLIFASLTKLNNYDVPFLSLIKRTILYSLPIDIIATYFTIYLLMPRFLFKGSYIKFILALIFSAIPFILLLQFLQYYLYIPTYYPEFAFTRGFWEFPYFQFTVSTYAIVILAASIKLTKRWLEMKEEKKELEKQNLKSELAMLKMQVSPHFLFNTLNNIDSLMYEDKERASEAIVRLSDIMRYMLYESQQRKVPLTKELEYLNNLIKLQELRLTKKDFIEFKVKGNPDNKFIPALLFVPFIENAIKHGDKKVDSPGIIVNLNIESSSLHFKIKNHINFNQQKDQTGGIGLNNVKRRLEILYPKKHSLKIIENDKIFQVDLEINLL